MPGFRLEPDHKAAIPAFADHVPRLHDSAADISTPAVHPDASVPCHEIVGNREPSLTA